MHFKVFENNFSKPTNYGSWGLLFKLTLKSCIKQSFNEQISISFLDRLKISFDNVCINTLIPFFLKMALMGTDFQS